MCRYVKKSLDQQSESSCEINGRVVTEVGRAMGHSGNGSGTGNTVTVGQGREGSKRFRRLRVSTPDLQGRGGEGEEGKKVKPVEKVR